MELSTSTPPFRFAGHPVCALNGVQLIASITDLQGKTHTLKLFSYVLPPTLVPFLLGLADRFRLSFDLCFRDRSVGHLRIYAWKKTFPLTVKTKVWLKLSLTLQDSLETRDWQEIIVISILPAAAHAMQQTQCSSAFIFLPEPAHPFKASNITYLAPPWRHDKWNPTLSQMELWRLYLALKHTESSSMSKIIGKSLEEGLMPLGLKKELEFLRCSECTETSELSRKQKLVIPPEAPQTSWYYSKSCHTRFKT